MYSCSDAKQMAVYLHLSQLLGYVLPILGWVAPIIIWSTQKDKYPEIDVDFKMVMNFLITILLLCVVGGVTACIGIGLVIFLYAGIVAVVFPIIAAINASNNIRWQYPLTIRFLK